MLVLPHRNKNFILRTDANNSGVSAVLLLYGSKKLLDRERRYSTIEKECLVVIWALKHFNLYLKGKKFTRILQTDH